MITKLIRLGKSSLVMVIPKAVLKGLGWKKEQKVSVSAKSRTFRIKDYKKRK